LPHHDLSLLGAGARQRVVYQSPINRSLSPDSALHDLAAPDEHEAADSFDWGSPPRVQPLSLEAEAEQQAALAAAQEQGPGGGRGESLQDMSQPTSQMMRQFPNYARHVRTQRGGGGQANMGGGGGSSAGAGYGQLHSRWHQSRDKERTWN
jgi:hypothetical protein